MASRRMIQFMGADGKRKTLSLSDVNAEQAAYVKMHVTRIVAAAVTSTTPQAETLAWVAGLSDLMHKKLVALGVVPERVKVAGPILAPFLDGYIKRRSDLKPGTTETLHIVRVNLIDYFGKDKPLADITPGDADEWRLKLIEMGLAANTVRKRCGIAKGFFKAAVRKRLIASNPFDDIKGGVQANPDKLFFVTRDVIAKVMEMCPNPEWRLIIALSRFGGLRCPSEHMQLRWGDINWEKHRITVHSPKTEHHEGKASRVVPLFPELVPYLQDAFADAPEGQEFVIWRYRKSGIALRCQFVSFIKRAGIQPWCRPFHNMRSTRETELAEKYPLHVVTSWLGNSQLIAAKHYLQITDEHFDRAAGALHGAANALQQTGEIGRNEPQIEPESAFSRNEPHIAANSGKGFVDEGLDITRKSLGNSRKSKKALQVDPDDIPSALAAFLANLTPEQRARLRELL